jgi:hypothetical protein
MSETWVVTVPVAVARLVVASRWAAGIDHNGPKTDPLGSYIRAVNSKWARGLRFSTTDDLNGLREPIDALLAELTEDGVRASVLKPVEEFASELEKFARLLFQEEQEELQRAQKRAEDLTASDRRWRTKRREKTMGGQIENGRTKVLMEICEDYGLDYKDPQLMAALISAFHSGAYKIREVVADVGVIEPVVFSEEWLAKRRNRDARYFADAHAAVQAKQAAS